MNAWSVVERRKAQCGFVQSSGCLECGECGRLRCFGHLEHNGVDDWVSTCRNVVVAGVRCVGRGRKTWGECLKDGMKLLGLQPEWAVFRDV